jgi:hypothetical protein
MSAKKTRALPPKTKTKPKGHPRPIDKPGVPPKTITITDEEPMTA